MTRPNLTTLKSFKESLLASVDVGVRIFICSRPKTDIERMYQRALTAAAMRHLHPRGRYHVSVELCAQIQSLALSTWWEATLILAQERGAAWLGIQERLWAFALEMFACCKEPTESSTNGNLPPPYKLFTPIPKSEVGGCARSDSLVRSLIH